MDNHETRNKTVTVNTLADAAALSNVERPGYSIPTPGAPGLINTDSVNDNVGSKQGDIGHFGTTDDLTPTLQGTIEGGEAQVLRIYANGVQLGSTTVGADGSWSFTPDTLEGGSKYAFEVVLKDPLTDEILVASETYTIITTASNGDTASIPEVDGLWDDIGEQKGPIHNGDTTDDAQPAIFGKADPGSVVVIYDNGQPVGSVTTNDNGNWTFTPETPLADGEHSITAAEVNADGKPGEQSPATDFIVDAPDTTPPAAATHQVLADDVGPVKGDIHNGDSTDDTQPTLSGQAEAGATVIVSDNGRQIGSAVVGDEGKWTFTPDVKLADGSHSFSTVVEDTAGNKSPASEAIGFTLDTHTDAPVIVGYLDDVGAATGTVENGGRTDDSNGLLSGHAEAGSHISLTMWGPRGMKYSNVAHTVTDSDGNWHIQLSDGSRELGNRGNWTFQVTAVDEAGNSARSDSFKVNYVASNRDDITAPDATTHQVLADDVGPVKGDIHNGDRTDDAQPTLSGQAEAGTTVIVSDNGKPIGSAVVGDDGKWTFTPDVKLADGSHSFSTVVEDAAGNRSPASDAIGFTVDTHTDAPVIVGYLDDVGAATGTVENGGRTDDSNGVLSGHAEAGSQISLTMWGPRGMKYSNVAHTVTDSDGNWHIQLSDGSRELGNRGNWTFQVTAADEAGNSASSDSFKVNYVASNRDDTTAPEATTHQVLADDVGPVKGDIHNGDHTDDAQPTLSGQAEAGTTVMVSDNGKQIGSAVVGDDGKWTFTPDVKLADGSHSFSTVVKDAGGNKSPASEAIGFTVDTAIEKPVITLAVDNVGVNQGDVLSRGTTDDTTPLLKGTAEAGSIVFINVGGNIASDTIGSTVADATGHWSFQIPDNHPLLVGDNNNQTPINVVSQDAAGNFDASDIFYLNVVPLDNGADTTPPAAATHQVLADDVGPVKGDIHNGDHTDDAQPTLSGQAEAGATVIVSDNGRQIGSAVVGDEGKWTFTPDVKLADGSHSFSTVVEDAAGNKSPASDAIGFTLDTHTDAPVIVGYLDDVGARMGTVENGGRTDDSNGVLSGHAEAGSHISLTMWGPRGMKYSNVAHTVTDSDGNWHIQLSDGSRELGNRGNWTFQVTAADEAGNSASSDKFKVNYVASNQDDTTAPEATTHQVLADDVGPVKGDIHNGDHTDDAQPTLSGQAEAGTTVIVSDNGKQIGSAVVGDDGKWTFTPDVKLADGSHSFSTVVEDAAGNKSPASEDIGFTLDTHTDAPVIVGYLDDVGAATGTVENGGRTDDSNGLLSGHAEAGSQISLTMWGPQGMKYSNVAHTVTDSDGNWHIQLSDGSRELGNRGNWTFQVTAADEAGNSASSDKFKVDYVAGNHDDTTAPDAPTINSYYDDVGGSQGSDGNGGKTDDTKPELHGKAEADSVVKIFEGTTEIGSVTAGSQGDWSYTTPQLNDGKHTFTATATDAAGNASVKSGGFVVNVDAVTTPDKPTLSYVFDNVQINHNVYGDNYAPPGDPYADLPMVNDLSPTLYGSGTANSTLHIYTNEGGTTMDTVKVGSDGSWTFTAQIGNGYNIWNGGIYLASWKIVPLDSNGNEVADHAYQSFDVWVNDITDYPYYSSLALQNAAVEPLHAVADVHNTDVLTQSDAANGVINLSALSPSEANTVAQSSMLNLHNGSEDTLALTLNDVLSHGQSDMFTSDGQQQLAVQGERGDTIELKLDDVQSQWQETGQSTIAGVTYEVYQQTESHAELFVQQGVELHQS
ncbi:Ig-like domain-containing protein [Dryocola clanedunensis]|uniref:Ig-like domain-containing protein n=1 Tax=Cedecea sulfonylureivorans TaxID=3051154 RepID=UPI001929203C|nr:Ig-like domain-containing protein [Cedecea sulfonylureivorans]